MYEADTRQRFIFENFDIRGDIVKLQKSYLETVTGKHSWTTRTCVTA